MHDNSFSRQTCCACGGAGQNDGNVSCVACQGEGSVMVMKPPIRCPRCHGTGRGNQNSFRSSLEFCEICFGTGWVRTDRRFSAEPT